MLQTSNSTESLGYEKKTIMPIDMLSTELQVQVNKSHACQIL